MWTPSSGRSGPPRGAGPGAGRADGVRDPPRHVGAGRIHLIALLAAARSCGMLAAYADRAQAPIKSGFVQGLTGPFEVYAKQEVNGFKLGLEYATGGKLEVLGRKIEVIVEDDQLKPDVSKQKV